MNENLNEKINKTCVFKIYNLVTLIYRQFLEVH